jgi:hypothetical protein
MIAILWLTGADVSGADNRPYWIVQFPFVSTAKKQM